MTLTPILPLPEQHILTLNPIIRIPETETDDHDKDYHLNVSSSEKLLSVWKKGQRLLNLFWKLWRDEYLLSLRQRMQTRLKGKRIQSSRIPQIGDVVLVKEDGSRGSWKLGKTLQSFSSRDGLVCSGKVQLL